MGSQRAGNNWPLASANAQAPFDPAESSVGYDAGTPAETLTFAHEEGPFVASLLLTVDSFNLTSSLNSQLGQAGAIDKYWKEWTSTSAMKTSE